MQEIIAVEKLKLNGDLMINFDNSKQVQWYDNYNYNGASETVIHWNVNYNTRVCSKLLSFSWLPLFVGWAGFLVVHL